MDTASVRVLEGEGFDLRVLDDGDRGFLVAASRTDVPDWTFIPRDLSEEAARAWIDRSIAARRSGQAIRFVIEVDGRPAGTVGAEHPYAHDPGIVETFYFVLPEYRRRGLATAALRLMDRWLQRAAPELRRLQLHVIVGNPGSARVAEGAGYVREGIAVNQIPSVNGFGSRDAIVFGKPIEGRQQAQTGGVLA